LAAAAVHRLRENPPESKKGAGRMLEIADATPILSYRSGHDTVNALAVPSSTHFDDTRTKGHPRRKNRSDILTAATAVRPDFIMDNPPDGAEAHPVDSIDVTSAESPEGVATSPRFHCHASAGISPQAA
jgi:hypothetical protein